MNHPERPAQPDRRQLFQWLGLGTDAAAPAQSPKPHARMQTSAHIVIVGSGLGGIAVANRLNGLLDGAKITIVNAKKAHNYQPVHTLVATSVWTVDKVRGYNADYHPPRAEWVQEMVAAFEPQANTVVTQSGKKIRYDSLIVATGLHLDYSQIKDMDVSAIGKNGLGSVYASPEAAQATWSAMDAMRQRGGRAVMTLPSGPLKCAGAPLKMTFMVRDRLHQAGTLGRSTVDFRTALPDNTVFGVKVVNDNVLDRWKSLGIRTHYLQRLAELDIGARNQQSNWRGTQVLAIVVGGAVALLAMLALPALARSSTSELAYIVDWLALFGMAVGSGAAATLFSWPALALLRRHPNSPAGRLQGGVA